MNFFKRKDGVEQTFPNCAPRSISKRSAKRLERIN